MAGARRINWLLVGLVLAVAAYPAYMSLKGRAFSKRKLDSANPTSYVFDAPAAAVRNAIDIAISAEYESGRVFGHWVPSGTDRHVGTENEYDLHQALPSESYFWLGKPLEYQADFRVLLTPVSEAKTRVEVQTSEAMVRIGGHFRRARR
jgi:hypothetical protein